MSNPPEQPCNRLQYEKSPYLLQHAANPVEWYAWGDEALRLAREQDKPIFLSVGYSTCHWCHVMERESFENEAIAALMNRYFVNIKIDREERPDIDRVYMAYVQASTGHGGWPMSVWLTPDLKPFVGGTYFPPQGRLGQPGFGDIVERIGRAWEGDRERVMSNADRILGQLRQIALGSSSDSGVAPIPDSIAAGVEELKQSFDDKHGGFGGAPKFPRPVALTLLLRHAVRTSDTEARDMVLHTLDRMADGGIHDHLGGGFHRYSVDRRWHVPHFEKMLYDQAQLVDSYLDAYLISGRERFAEVAESTIRYVLRDLTDPKTGAFFSAEDADSADQHGRKREGAFYVWRYDDLVKQLGDDAGRFCTYYGATSDGNATDPHGELDGTNVLSVVTRADTLAREEGSSVAILSSCLSDCRSRLLQERSKRARPHLDDKVICSWNGMMIGALARASTVLRQDAYCRAAVRAALFVKNTMYDGETGQLLRRFRDDDAAVSAFAEDYAQLIRGLIALYQATFDVGWLTWAAQLMEHQVDRFYDATNGGFFADDGQDTSVLLRLKDDYDGAEPSASSVSANNLLQLASLCGRPDWLELAHKTIEASADRLRNVPQSLPLMLVALDAIRHSDGQLVWVGPEGEELSLLRDTVRAQVLPNLLQIHATDAYLRAFGDAQPHIQSMTALDGKPTAYFCVNQSCQSPTNEPDELMSQLNAD